MVPRDNPSENARHPASASFINEQSTDLILHCRSAALPSSIDFGLRSIYFQLNRRAATAENVGKCGNFFSVCFSPFSGMHCSSAYTSIALRLSPSIYIGQEQTRWLFLAINVSILLEQAPAFTKINK
jgi:hypothetical protein